MSDNSAPDTEIKGSEGQTSFTAKANETTAIRVKSRLQRARFDRGVSSPGATCGVTVYAAFVARGTPAQVELKDANGTVGTLDAKLNRSDQTIPFQVPKDAENHLRATVKLPDLGLETTTSGVIRLTKPIWVKRIKFTRDGRQAVQQVRAGEEIEIVADVAKAGAGWPATVTVYRYAADGIHEPVHRVQATVDPNEARVRVPWTVRETRRRGDIPSVIPAENGSDATEGEGEPGAGASVEYAPPSYFAEVDVLGVAERSHESGRDTGRVELVDPYVLVVESKATGAPIPGATVNVHAPDGTETEEEADDAGRIEIEDALPGVYTVHLLSVPAEEDADGE